MSQWQKCPVCDGTGLVSRPPGVPGDAKEFTTTETGPWPCRACQGACVIPTPESVQDLKTSSPIDFDQIGDVWAKAVKVVGALFDDSRPRRK